MLGLDATNESRIGAKSTNLHNLDDQTQCTYVQLRSSKLHISLFFTQIQEFPNLVQK